MDDSEGISDERYNLEMLIYFAVSYETIALALLDMGWIADGISDTEAGAMRGIAKTGVAVGESVIALTWIADGISSYSEVGVIFYLARIASQSATVAEMVIALPWVADGISDSEWWAIFSLTLIAESSVAVAESVIALPWVADGISDNEQRAISKMRGIAKSNATVAEMVIALPWVADGISDGEADFIKGLGLMPQSIQAATERIVALPWVADGVSDSEASFTMGLNYIARADADAALQVMDMPFLQTPEAADMAALDTLAVIAYNDEDRLADVLSRPMLKDCITDDEAPIVSMLNSNPDLVDKLLDPNARIIERRTVELSLAGEVDHLVIVRTSPGARRSMDILENAVREAENLMGEPLPTRYVGVLFWDVFGDSSSPVGINYGSHIALLPEYDADDGSYAAGISPRLIAHEVAHYYWRGGAGWLVEGMAELMASAIENRRVGTPVNITMPPCKFARSIMDLEALPSEQPWTCSYSLGERLFVSLLRTLGEDAFWDSARNLYVSSRAPYGLSRAHWLYYMSLGLLDSANIEEVRQAFGADASDVIARWYGGR